MDLLKSKEGQDTPPTSLCQQYPHLHCSCACRPQDEGHGSCDGHGHLLSQEAQGWARTRRQSCLWAWMWGRHMACILLSLLNQAHSLAGHHVPNERITPTFQPPPGSSAFIRVSILLLPVRCCFEKRCCSWWGEGLCEDSPVRYHRGPDWTPGLLRLVVSLSPYALWPPGLCHGRYTG